MCLSCATSLVPLGGYGPAIGGDNKEAATCSGWTGMWFSGGRREWLGSVGR